MIRDPSRNKILWWLTAVLSLIVALAGVFSPSIYSKVVSTDLMPAIFGQDSITIVASIIILLLTIRIKKEDSKKQIVILGIMAIKKKGLGLLLIPAIFILGFTLIFSLAVSEIVKPLYDSAIDIAGLGSSLVLSIVFLILAAQHLRKLKLDL
ncbi:MAG: hypothetical protein J7L08_01390 [Candidatus Aenigmarchaeota archaeon]|nr:hypothetical protein [Candidatus Aenigmarchaeota archaeon]